MKKKIIASLLVGVGLIVCAVPGHGKPSHSSAKKPPFAAVKHGKKHTVGGKSARPKKTRQPFAASAVGGNKRHGRTMARVARVRLGHHKPRGAMPKSLEQHLPLMADNGLELPPDHDHGHDHAFDGDHTFDTDDHIADDHAANAAYAQPAEQRRVHQIIRVDGKLSLVTQRPEPLETARHPYRSAHGVIRSSLADAAEQAGLAQEIAEQLTSIFAWDIDFASRLHRGDEFTVVYEDTLAGPVVAAAEFVNRGRVLTAVRYQDGHGGGYYTPEGKAMRKAFLSTPVEFARVSSHFDINRRHPILNRIRAHKGVDYAARTGTPVKSTGDGTITFLGRKGGYGQVIVIQHGERYETVYAHLSRFRRELQEGDSVRQGEIIGYVGQTGLATGPHLHYEFRVDGVHRNPESIQHSRQALALNGQALGEFKRQAQPPLAALYHTKAQTLLARNQLRVE